MSSFTALSDRDINEILGLYQLGPVHKVEQTGFGLSNTNIRINCQQGEFLLKVSNDKSLEQIHGEQEILSKIGLLGYDKIILPLTTAKGETIYKWGRFYGCVYPFVNGSTPETGPTVCKKIGIELARLHQCSLGRDLSQVRDYTSVGFGPEQLKQFASLDQVPKFYFEAWQKFLPAGLDQLIQDIANQSLPQAIIHGDLYYDNTLFKDKKLICLLDFEQGGRGEALFDLCVSVTGSCHSDNKIQWQKTKAMLEGYQSIRPLLEIEKKYLFDMLKLSLFSIARWRIDRFVTKKIDPSKQDSYRELLQRLESLNAIEENINGPA